MLDERTEATRRVLTEFSERFAAKDDGLWEDLVAADFVNHATGTRGRDAWRATFATLRHDLGDYVVEEHRVLVDGDMAAVRSTIRGRHIASTMPLLRGVPVTGMEIAWEFQHLFRVQDGKLAEHWACRDDLGLLVQLGAWSPGS